MGKENALRGKTNTWVWQIFENAPGVRYRAALQWSKTLGEEKRPAVLRAAIMLHGNLARRPSLAGRELEDELYSRLRWLLASSETPLDPAWVRWIAGLADGGERLAKVLEPIGDRYSQPDTEFDRRDRQILEHIAREVEMLEVPDAAVLAAGWLVDPDDWLMTGQPLAQRVQEAIGMLTGRKTDRGLWEDVVAVLRQAIDQVSLDAETLVGGQQSEANRGHASYQRLHDGTGRADEFERRYGSAWQATMNHKQPLVAVAQALRTVGTARLAVPLLEKLLCLPLKPYLDCGWWEEDY